MTDTVTTKPSRRPRRMAREAEPSTLNNFGSASSDDAAGAEQQSVDTQPIERRETKASQVLAILHRPEGATLDDLVALTGWLPHTMRAALTGLRKKGHTIERRRDGDTNIYKITTADTSVDAAATPDQNQAKPGSDDGVSA